MNAIEGKLQDLPLARVLRSIAAASGSGILTVQGEDDIVAVSFLNGGIVAADALNQTVEEGLGEALQRLDLLSEEHFTAAARDHAGGGSGSLGELLVDRGLVSRSDLLQGLRAQTFGLMLRILTWRQGELKFYGGDEVSYEDGFQPIPVAELLVRAIEDLGEKARFAGRLPDLDGIYSQRPAEGTVRILGPDGDGTEAGIWLTPRESELLAQIDGRTSAAVLSDRLGLGADEATLALYNFRRHELVVYVGEAGPPSEARIETRRPPAEAAPLRAEIFTPPEPAAAGVPAAGVPAAGGPGFEAAAAAVPPEAAPAAGAPAAAGLAAVEAERPPAIAIERWAVPALALGLVAAMILALLPRPGASLLPFPWQDNQRNALERQLRQSLFLKIDRAAKVYFLVKAHYPDSLDDMIELGLLSPADLRDPAGYALSYSTDEVGYRIDLVEPGARGPAGPAAAEGQTAEALGTTESITGDFLLDPQWLRLGTTEEAPLVLLD